MKKLSYLLVLFLVSSCQEMVQGIGGGYCNVTEWQQQEAQSMYNSLGTTIVEMETSEIEELFGSCYENGDNVYLYKTLWGNKYILARYGRAVKYIKGDAYDAKKKNSSKDYYKNKANLRSSSQKNIQWF